MSFTRETTLAGHGAPNCTLSEFAFGFHGEHDIPGVDIRRRYARSLMRAPEALRLAGEAIVLDNSGLHPVGMLLFENGVVVWSAEVLAEWAGQLA